jgi:integrase
VSARKETTHIITEGELLVALRERSTIWQCRYKIDGAWQRTTTGERDLKKAKAKAKEISLEAHIRKKNNITPITRLFRDVARGVVKKLETQIAQGVKKPVNRDYVIVLTNYLIPILGKYKVDSIDYKVLNELDEKRIEKMGRVPSLSTLLNHNAALNMVFDEAIYKGYMSPVSKPVLKARGRKSEKRIEFSVKEVRALRGGFENWISRGRADTRELRALLRDYVEVLLDTGARPGKEVLDLKWAHIELDVKSNIKSAGEYAQEEDQVLEIFNWSIDRSLYLKILTGKTSKKGGRLALGTTNTYNALERIAERNYGLKLPEAISKCAYDHIFRYREYLNVEQQKTGEVAKLIPPTSFVKLFRTYLSEHNLLVDLATNKERQPYSLRHTYATMRLLHDRVTPQVLVKQMGTSIAMLEKHYDHIMTKDAASQLKGDESRQLIRADIILDEKYQYKDSRESKRKKS